MELKIYKVDFEPIYPTGCCCIICSTSKEEALIVAKTKITWGTLTLNNIEEIDMKKNTIIEFISGDY